MKNKIYKIIDYVSINGGVNNLKLEKSYIGYSLQKVKKIK